MRKILSVLLVICLLITTCIGAFKSVLADTVDSANKELIVDGTFDLTTEILAHSSSKTDVWMQSMAPPTIKKEGNNSVASLTTDTVLNVNNKGNSLLLYGLGDKLKAGIKYQLSFDVKISASSNSFAFYLVTNDIWSGEDTSCQKDFYPSAVNTWEHITYIFTPTDAKYNLLRFQTNSGYEVCVDNISLVEYTDEEVDNLLIDGRFNTTSEIKAHSSTETDIWMGTMASPTLKSEAANKMVSLTTENSNKGNSLLVYCLGDKVKAGSKYQLSFDMKGSAASKPLGFYLVTSDIWSDEDSSCQKDFYTSSAYKWEHITYTFTISDKKFNLLRFQVNAGYEICIDNIVLTECVEADENVDLIKDGGFDVTSQLSNYSSTVPDVWSYGYATWAPSLTTDNENKVVSLYGTDSVRGAILTYVLSDKYKANTEYKLTFKMKASAENKALQFYLAKASDVADAMHQTNFNATTDWQPYSFTFTPTDNAYNMLRFQTDTGYQVLLDDISLNEVIKDDSTGGGDAGGGDPDDEDKTSPYLIIDGSFDNTSTIDLHDSNKNDKWLYSMGQPTLKTEGGNNLVSLNADNTEKIAAILIYNLGTKLVKNSEYQLSFRIKPTAEAKALDVALVPSTNLWASGVDFNTTIYTGKANEWQTVTQKFTVTDTTYNALKFQAYEGYEILIDDISLVDLTALAEFKVTVKGEVSADSLDFGRVEPSSVQIDKTEFVAGKTTVNMNAVSSVGATFVGWYKDPDCDKLISTASELSYKPETAENITLYAKFKSNNLIGQKFADSYDTSGFENEATGSVRMPIADADLNNTDKDKRAKYESSQLPKKLSNTIKDFKNGDASYGKWFVEYVEDNEITMAYADFEDLQVAANPLAGSDKINNSAQSLYLSTWYRSIVRRVEGLKKGKTYLITFDYYTLTSREGDATKEVLKAGITNDYDKYFKDSADANGVYYHNNKWSTGSFLYTHTDTNSNAYLRFESSNYAGGLYLDNLCVLDVSKQKTITATAEVMEGYETYGTVSTTKHVGISGKQMTVVANPFGTYSFEGWFDEKGNKKSADQVYTFTPTSNIKLFAKFNVVKVDIISGKGGSVSGDTSGYYESGTAFTVTAHPIKGNEFVGWYDNNTDTLLSSDTTYSFTAYNNISVIAKFVGDNIEPREILNFNSFEDKNNLGNWSFFDDSVSVLNEEWCSMAQSKEVAYSGQYSLKATAPYRDVTVDLGYLEPNTDYVASFYIYLGKETELIHTYILGGSNGYAFANGDVIATGGLNNFIGDGEWHKIIIPFNSNTFTSGKLGFEYWPLQTELYIDDLQLVEYRANEAIVNPEFKNGSDDWFGEAGVTSDGFAEIASGDSIYQYFQTNHNAEYKLTYKVKVNKGGELIAGVYDPLSKSADYKDLITSYSYDKATNTVWEEHTVVLFAGDNNFVKIMFTNTGNQSAFIDSVSMISVAEAANGKTEVIDFENGRYPIIGTEQQKSFELNYDSEYVHSGNTALRYIHKNGVNAVLDQAWIRLPLYTNKAFKYTLTMYVKTQKGNVFHISPDADYKYIKAGDCKITAADNGWMLVTYEFVNSRLLASVDMVLKNISKQTKADLYVDDIVLKCTSAYIENTDVDELYCTDLYNKVNNPDFEQVFTEKDWKNYIPQDRVVIGDAHSRDKFLRLKAGDRFVIPVDVELMDSYIFAASGRSVNGGKGSVMLAVDPFGKVPLSTLEGSSRSIINIDSKKWSRSGFIFCNGSYDPVYIVLECTKGSIDVDALAIFRSYSKYKDNPYNYKSFKEFDYDAFLASVDENTILHEEENVHNTDEVLQNSPEADDFEQSLLEQNSPETGDFEQPLLAVMSIIITLCAAILMLVKREEMK